MCKPKLINESQKMGIKKLVELIPIITPADFIDEETKPDVANNNFTWWLNSLIKLRDAKDSVTQIEECKMMKNFTSDIKGVIKFSIIDYLDIVTQ